MLRYCWDSVGVVCGGLVVMCNGVGIVCSGVEVSCDGVWVVLGDSASRFIFSFVF